MERIPLNSTYETTDTATAAYLCSLGFGLIRITNNSPRSAFVFEDSISLRAAAQSFETATAIGNVANFYRQYRRLLREVKGSHDEKTVL